MHERAAEFVECAAETYGFEPDVREFESGTKSVAAAADAIGCDPAQIVKSMIMVAGGEMVVALTAGTNRVDEAALAEEFDVDASAVRTASAEEIKSQLGWSIGGVPPFCHRVSIPALYDATLDRFDRVWAGAGTPSAMFPLSPERLRSYSNADYASVFME